MEAMSILTRNPTPILGKWKHPGLLYNCSKSFSCIIYDFDPPTTIVFSPSK